MTAAGVGLLEVALTSKGSEGSPILCSAPVAIEPAYTFAWNKRAALDCHRQVLEHISRIAQRL
jgi:hypothetical protein